MTRADGEGSPCSRWLVLVAVFVCHITTVSVSYNAGVMHVALLETFHHNVVTTAWLGSVYSSMSTLIGPVASLMITIFDCRTCLILSGLFAGVGFSSCFFISHFNFLYPAFILAGIGQGFSLVTSYVAIGYNFPHQASLLTGICICGSGIGIFIHPPLLQSLVEWYGLRGAMLVMGAVALHALPCGLAVPPSHYEIQLRSARKRQQSGPSFTFSIPKNLTLSLRSLLDVLSDFRFLLLLLTAFGFSSALSTYYIYLPEFLLHNHYDHLTASFVISATGMGSIPSRLLIGVASNDVNIDTTTLVFGLHTLAAVCTLLVPLSVHSLSAQMVLAVMFGVYSGAVWVSVNPLLLELLGVRRVAYGVGLYFFTMGVGYLAGPPLAAKLFTLTNNSHNIFYFTACMFGLAGAATILSVLVPPKADQHNPGALSRRTSQELWTDATSTRNQNPDSLLPQEAEYSLIIVAEINNKQGTLISGNGDTHSINCKGENEVPEIPTEAQGLQAVGHMND